MSDSSPSRPAATTSAPRKPAVKKSAAKKSAGKKSGAESATKRSVPTTSAPKTTAAKTTIAKTTAAKTSATRRAAAPRGAFAAGAARASGERRRRTGTPLLPTETVELSPARRQAVTLTDDGAAVETVSPVAAVTPESTSPAPPRRRPTRSSMRTRRTSTSEQPRLHAVPTEGARNDDAVGAHAPSDDAGDLDTSDRTVASEARTHTSNDTSKATSSDASSAPGSVAASDTHVGGWEHALTSGIQSRAERLVGAVLESAEFSSEARPGPAELVDLAVNVLRAAATSAGLPAEDVERQVAQTLAYLRRRLSGDYVVDQFGFDEDYTLNVHLPLLRPFYRKWFRVEVRGIENIPSVGGALVVGNHSGTIAMDSLMTQVAVYDEHPDHRHLRMLGADLVFQIPFIGTMARRSGSTLAATTDAERLLRGGELVGVWPEGFKGVGKPFSERYKLQRFGRGGFVSAALRAGVPIVPVSIVGAEEIYPILGDMPAVARLLGMPYAPITPTWPLLGPLGLVPLPSKWLIEFGPPIETTSFGPDAAEDPMLVFDLTDQVRETIQQTLYSLLMQRRSVFL
ncbi:MAG: 1-acyl-sn-glycerol-3-phosphate acyltransferase [Humibacillus sp.]